MTGVAYDQGELGRMLGAWLLPVAADVDDRGRLVNKACRLAEDDPGLTRAADPAARLGVSPRSLERLVRSHKRPANALASGYLASVCSFPQIARKTANDQ